RTPYKRTTVLCISVIQQSTSIVLTHSGLPFSAHNTNKMFAKLFIVALAVVCASAATVENSRVYYGRSGFYPLAYSAGVVPTYSYNAPVASYSTYSGTPVTYSTYSGIPSVYSAPASIVAVCSMLAVASANPHVLTPVGPAVVTAQSSQVFARTYNGFVPFAVPAAPVPAPVPAPAYHFHTPAFVLPAPPAPVFYPQPVVYNPPVPVAVPAAPAAVLPTVVAAAPAAKLVAAAPVAKVAKLVRPAPFHATFRYRSVVA
uniref:Uncharacterized protein n=1 Tax=Anopheles minimus TaxID=112268 RepID=A0A182WJW0_9DIPT